MQVSLDPSGVLDYLVAIDARIKNLLIERVDAVTQMLVDRLHVNLTGAVLQRRSGRLDSSVHSTDAYFDGYNIQGGTVTAGGEEAPYGDIFETGGSTYYHIIPIDARVLSWMQEGKRLFATYIDHPPAPYLPWFTPETEKIQAEFDTQINQAIDEAL